jgi:hypothetical protein
MRRVRQLAFVLVALGLAATAAAGAAPPTWRWPARLALLFGLPLAASVAASLLLPRERGREGSSARVAGTGRLHAVIAAAILIDLAPIGIGYLLGWTTFTFGEQALEARKLLAVPLALPFTIAAATLGTEWALRARLYEAGARAGDAATAARLSIVAGTALAMPFFAPGFEAASMGVLVSWCAISILREATSLALFRAGGLLPVGAWRGSLAAIEAFGLADWSLYHFPMANYVSSEPAFDLLRVAGPAAALALVVVAARRRKMRP